MRKVRRATRAIIVRGLAVLLVAATATFSGQAAYRIARPIEVGGGVIRQTYLWGENGGHKGVDFSYNLGTPVYASDAGAVVGVKSDRPDGDRVYLWGNYVLIRHNRRHYDRSTSTWAYIYSMYLHLKRYSVRVNVGDQVLPGQWIAEVDDTGTFSEGNHLHLQIVAHPLADRTIDTLDSANRSRNPELWLSPYNGTTGTVVGRLANSNGDLLSGWQVKGLQKQSGWGYGYSQTYAYSFLNRDDLLLENWATTDVTPGTHALSARLASGGSTTTLGTAPRDETQTSRLPRRRTGCTWG